MPWWCLFFEFLKKFKKGSPLMGFGFYVIHFHFVLLARNRFATLFVSVPGSRGRLCSAVFNCVRLCSVFRFVFKVCVLVCSWLCSPVFPDLSSNEMASKTSGSHIRITHQDVASGARINISHRDLASESPKLDRMGGD